MSTLENLVLTNRSQNLAKSSHLARAALVSRWADRLRTHHRKLGELARCFGWDSAPATTLGVAQALYAHLPAGVPLWVGADGGASRFEPANPEVIGQALHSIRWPAA
jgi:hypothetical protein